MLSVNAIAAWGISHQWAGADQVEQDLLLSRAICAIAGDSYLGDQLLFRGGTALHKLHLPRALRYSEDLDYVRTTPGGIKPITEALFDLGRSLGFHVSSRISEHPKVYWRATSQAGNPLRIKVEVNTHERSPAMDPIRLPYKVDSPWWTGAVDVPTFQLPEMIATKIRALYQRSKGRDLFDMWLALTMTSMDIDDVLVAFDRYRPARYTAGAAIKNLEAKLTDPDFRNDLDQLVVRTPEPYGVDSAANMIVTLLLSRL